MKRKLISSLAALILIGTLAPAASAQFPGQTCSNGNTLSVIYPVGNLVHLLCTQVSGKWVWVNADGKLATTVTTLPQAVSGLQYDANIAPKGGTPPYTCSLAPGSILPHGFQLALCQIIALPVPLLTGGTTKSISKSFTVIYQDSANPAASLRSTFQLVTVTKAPRIILPPGATCMVNFPCRTLIAQGINGVPPYHFQSDTLRKGVLPWGMVVGVDGFLIGIPTRVGNYVFGVCVVDFVATENCGVTGTRIIPQPNQSSPTPMPTPIPTKTTQAVTTAYDGNYSGTFSVYQTNMQSTDFPGGAMSITGLTFTLHQGTFSGVITGPADFSLDYQSPNHVYGRKLTFKIMGFACTLDSSIQSNGIDFDIPKGSKGFVTGDIICQNGTKYFDGQMSGPKVG